MPDKPDMALASMGIYVFATQVPVRPAAPRRRRSQLQPRFRQGHHPVSGEARQGAWRTASPSSCVRSGFEAEAYWRDVGTVDAYWEANIDLTDVIPALDLYDSDWPIWTYAEVTPPAKFVHDDDGRRGQAVEFAGLRRLHRLRRVAAAFAAVHRRAHALLRQHRERRRAALRRHRPLAPGCATSSSIAACGSRKAWWSARTRWPTRSASAAPSRASA